MTKEKSKWYIINGNTLKILAAFFMLIDHIGVLFFSENLIFRMIGRLSFPIFAFMIAEGCRYTRNKLRYWSLIAILGVACQTVYYLYNGSTYINVLVTFSIAILLIYILQRMKKVLIVDRKTKAGLIYIILFVVAVFMVYSINTKWTIDYGFWGCMLPVFATMLQLDKSNWPLNNNLTKVISLGVGLLIMAYEMGGRQWFSLFAVPLLMLYSNKKGKRNMKYFFYIFYPAHLVILQGIYSLIY